MSLKLWSSLITPLLLKPVEAIELKKLFNVAGSPPTMLAGQKPTGLIAEGVPSKIADRALGVTAAYGPYVDVQVGGLAQLFRSAVDLAIQAVEGSVAKPERPMLYCWRSNAKKKNVLFLKIGPPSEPPQFWLRSGGFFWPGPGVKKGDAAPKNSLRL